MDEERRKSVRIKKVITVRYNYGADTGEKKWDMTVVRDISETGMSIATNHKFSPNDIVDFLIKIPSRPLDWIELTGRVVASKELKSVYTAAVTAAHTTRVEFTNLKEDKKELIRQYVTWFLSKEGGGQK